MKQGILGVLIILSTACNTFVKEEERQVENTKSIIHKIESVKINNEILNAIYPPYINLSDAFINEDKIIINQAIMSIEVGVEDLKANDKLKQTVNLLASAKGIENQRNIFSKLSNEMIARIKQSGLQKGVIYLVHCPMADSDKGANWLSNQSQIRNPYYGDKMLDCGEITDTLK